MFETIWIYLVGLSWAHLVEHVAFEILKHNRFLATAVTFPSSSMTCWKWDSQVCCSHDWSRSLHTLKLLLFGVVRQRHSQSQGDILCSFVKRETLRLADWTFYSFLDIVRDTFRKRGFPCALTSMSHQKMQKCALGKTHSTAGKLVGSFLAPTVNLSC